VCYHFSITICSSHNWTSKNCTQQSELAFCITKECKYRTVRTHIRSAKLWSYTEDLRHLVHWIHAIPTISCTGFVLFLLHLSQSNRPKLRVQLMSQSNRLLLCDWVVVVWSCWCPNSNRPMCGACRCPNPIGHSCRCFGCGVRFSGLVYL